MNPAPTHPRRDDIRIMDPDFHVAPFAAYAWMRRHAPVYWDDRAPTWDGIGAWGVTRYADIRTVAASDDIFVSRCGSRPDAPPVPSMINRDAPEEMLRWVTPVKTIARTVTQPCVLGGQQLGPGEKVILLFEAGNRDEVVFPAPDCFDIRREPNRHLAFGGYGRHHCLGAHLARLELRVMIEELVARLPRLARVDDLALPRRYGTFVLGYESVPVRF